MIILDFRLPDFHMSFLWDYKNLNARNAFKKINHSLIVHTKIGLFLFFDPVLMG